MSEVLCVYEKCDLCILLVPMHVLRVSSKAMLSGVSSVFFLFLLNCLFNNVGSIKTV